MKLSNQINWGIIALMLFAFVIVSMAELRALQSNTSALIADEKSKR